MSIHATPPARPALDAPAADRTAEARAKPAVATDRSHRLATLGLIAVMIAGVSVFWLFEALPFQDLPAHAGLIAMRHRFEASAFEQRYYVLAPHIGPYSLFRFLGEAFVRVAGPVSAVRALGTLPVIATPLAMLFARRRLYADTSPTYGFLGVALSFGIMTLLGFASYLLGVAVMLVGLTLWLDLLTAADDDSGVRPVSDSAASEVRRRASSPSRTMQLLARLLPMARTPVRKRELIVAAFAPLMFIAHGHAFLLFVVCAGLSAIVTGRRLQRLLRLRALLPALALAGWVAWIERGTTAPPGSAPRIHQLIPRFEGLAEKLGLLFSPTLMTRTGIDFVAGFLLVSFTIACAIVSARSLGRRAGLGAAAAAEVRHSRALYACAAAIAIVFAVLPHAVGWFGFVDGRLVPVALILALLSIRRPTLPRSIALILDYGPPVLASTIAVLALVASYRFQDEARGYKEVLTHVPAESRLLNLPLDPNSDVFTAHPFIHYDKLALVERPLVVSDIWFHQGSALHPTPENPVLRLPDTYSESNLKFIDWPAYHLNDWDYVLIRTRPHATQPHTPDSLALEEHRGGWWLFRRASLGVPHGT